MGYRSTHWLIIEGRRLRKDAFSVEPFRWWRSRALKHFRCSSRLSISGLISVQEIEVCQTAKYLRDFNSYELEYGFELAFVMLDNTKCTDNVFSTLLRFALFIFKFLAKKGSYASQNRPTSSTSARKNTDTVRLLGFREYLFMRTT